MDTWLLISSKPIGRDKLARTLQYASKILWHYLESKGDGKSLALQFKLLENTLSMFRKLLRFGKFIDVLYGCLNTLHLQDPFHRLAVTLGRVYQSLFLFFDHFIWLGRSGLLNLNVERISQISNRFWLGSVVTNLFRDIYEIKRICELRTGCRAQQRNYAIWNSVICSRDFAPIVTEIVWAAEHHRDVIFDTLKNFCDLWIPMNGIGMTKLSPRAIGLLGVISSLIGLAGVVNPRVKLLPA